VNESFKGSMGCNGRLGLQRLPRLPCMQRLPWRLPSVALPSLALPWVALLPCFRTVCLRIVPRGTYVFKRTLQVAVAYGGKVVFRLFSACFPKVSKKTLPQVAIVQRNQKMISLDSLFSMRKAKIWLRLWRSVLSTVQQSIERPSPEALPQGEGFNPSLAVK